MSDKQKSGLPATIGERLVNGIFKENPTFVLLLGMCPTLAVTTSAMNGLGMGLTTMVVLAMSNLIISALRKIIPDKIRIPAFIVIIASFVTMVELLLEAYLPSLYDALGIYIPLIVVNCIILGRAEAYAYSHNAVASLFDGIGMGLGFTMALTIIGALRELLGAGAVFGCRIMPASYVPVNIFVMAPGAFFVLALLTAIQNKIKEIGTKRGKDMSKIQSDCGGNCLECPSECRTDCTSPKKDKLGEKEEKPEEKAEDKPEEAKKEEGSKEPEAAPTAESVAEAEPAAEPAPAAEPEPVAAPEPATEPEPTEEPEPVAEPVAVSEPENAEDASEEKSSDSDKVLEPKPSEVKAEEPEKPKKKNAFLSFFKKDKKESANVEEDKKEELPKEEDKQEAPAPSKEEASPETADSAAPDETISKAEDTKEPAPVEEDGEEVIIIDSEDGEGFEVFDLDEYMKLASKKPKTGKKPPRKKGNTAKAMAMLSKAEETIKEDGEDD